MAIVQVIKGDITVQAVDAIVNAANTTLLGGGGVDGAIHRAAGPQLFAACRALNGCPTGEARLTPGFLLPADYVIHTPGPIWRDGQHQEAALLASCYRQSLLLAKAYHLTTVDFPSISTGVYGYPLQLAAQVAIATIMAELRQPMSLSRVRIVAYDAHTQVAYETQLAEAVRRQR